VSRRSGVWFGFVDALTRSDHIPNIIERPPERSDQAPFPRDFPCKMTRTDPEFSADIIEVIIDVGFAAIDDHGNLPRRFAGFAPLQEFLFTFGESNRLGLDALRGGVMVLIWRRTSRNRGAVVHD